MWWETTQALASERSVSNKVMVTRGEVGGGMGEIDD